MRLQSVHLECTYESHTAMKLSPPVMALCPLIGYQGLGEPDAIELRNCPVCKSTLCLAVPETAAVEYAETRRV